jgi:putative aldouronate transport system substrate-binding protein
MKKRFALLSLALAAMLPLSACSKKQDTQANTSAEKTTELKMCYVSFGPVPKDLDAVTAEINKITKAKINATVKVEAINVGAYGQQINLKLSSNEDMDLFVTGTLSGLFDYSGFAAKGQLYALDDLIKKNGDGIVAALGTDFLNAAKVGGKIYGVPTVKDMALARGIYMRKDMTDKYGIDVKKIKTLDDVESVMKIMKQKEPNLYFNAFNQVSIVDMLGVAADGDLLGDGLGVLMNPNDSKVVNYYETPEYASLLKTIRKWYTAGYILPDAANNKESAASLIKANKIYAYFGVQNPTSEASDTKLVGLPIVVSPMGKPAIASTSCVTNFMWAVPNYSKKAEKAVQFLNLMYTDKDIVNLFGYGIEGKHYAKTSGTDQTIDFAPGVNDSNSGYNLNQVFMFGNEFLAHVWNGNPVDLWKQIDTFNKGAVKSKAIGFLFDVTPVKTEYAAVSNVVAQYKPALENGAVDIDKVLPEFISKLKAAGIDKIVAEKQKQLNEWAASNK